MNHKQVIFIWFGLAIIVLMCLFPPWLRTRIQASYKWPLPSHYAFIFIPPELVKSSDGLGENDKVGKHSNITATIDIRRLLVQCGIVFLSCGVLVSLYRSKDKNI
jgi:hypothetical protein